MSKQILPNLPSPHYSLLALGFGLPWLERFRSHFESHQSHTCHFRDGGHSNQGPSLQAPTGAEGKENENREAYLVCCGGNVVEGISKFGEMGGRIGKGGLGDRIGQEDCVSGRE